MNGQQRTARPLTFALAIAAVPSLLGQCGGSSPRTSVDAGSDGDDRETGNPGADAANALDSEDGQPEAGSPSADDGSQADAPGGGAFVLRPEWSGPCVGSPGAIDVNLGNSPESFVRAAYCQIHGSEPAAATVTQWAGQLRTAGYVRRIDVVRTLCNEQNRTCTLTYSNPWLTDVPRTATCLRKGTRDVGAVMMFFFNCPNMPNCQMDWANTHAWGMSALDPIYGFGSSAAGYYAPTNVGFWMRELLDARFAGLEFVLPNVYGFDIQPSTGQLQNLEAALTAIDAMGAGIRVGLFADTWAWGKAPGGPLMNPAPDLSMTESAAQRIYDVQWKPFFQGISKTHWYTVDGAPLIYFYNAGSLQPTSGASAVLARAERGETQNVTMALTSTARSGSTKTRAQAKSCLQALQVIASDASAV